MVIVVGYLSGTGELSLTVLLTTVTPESTVLGSIDEHSSVALMEEVSWKADWSTVREPHSLYSVALALLLGAIMICLDVVFTSCGMSLAVALLVLVEFVSFPVKQKG